MSGHGHSHSCEGTANLDETPEMGIEYSLYTKIDMENLECLNESVPLAGRSVFCPWERRLDPEKYVESDVDEELLFNIPFTGNIKLKGVILIGGNSDSNTHPAKMRLFKNRPNMTFDDVRISPDEEFEMHVDPSGTLEYPTKVVKFSSVYHLTIHIPSNFGAETSVVNYIGLRGEWSPAHRHGVTICTYEATPNVSDHTLTHADHLNVRQVQ